MADLDGLSSLEKALKRKVAGILVAAERAVDDAAEAIKDDARRTVPHDTGRLRNAIDVNKVSDDIREVGVTDRDAYYGQFIEHGTSGRPARPFLLPAAERERRRFPQRVRDAINKEL